MSKSIIIQQVLCRSEFVSESKILKTLKKALAFTLAETLIVMGIIGVVAALTIPNLNSSTANKEKVAKVKKIYANLEDAVGRAQAVYGPVEDWIRGKSEADRHKIFYERISEFLKVQKTCAPNTTGCFSRNTMQALNSGYTIGDEVRKYYQVILADGSSVSFDPYTDGVITEERCFNFYVDIDGPSKGTFTAGKDAFLFVGTPKNGLNKSWGVATADLMAQCFKFGNTCSSWVLENDNMDYLNAGIDGKCKNNTSLVLNSLANPPVTACK